MNQTHLLHGLPHFVLVLTALVLPGCDGRMPIPDGALVIRNGTIIDGTGAQPIQVGIVVVEGDRVLAVGSEEDFRTGPGYRVVDAGGGTILPGLINSHIHHGAPAETGRLFLPVGVTSICDLGSDISEMDEFLDPGWNREAPRPVPDLESTRAVVEDPTPREAWVVDVVLDIVRRFHEAGGMDVIVAATRNNARACSQEETLGTLEPSPRDAFGSIGLSVLLRASRTGPTH